MGTVISQKLISLVGSLFFSSAAHPHRMRSDRRGKASKGDPTHLLHFHWLTLRSDLIRSLHLYFSFQYNFSPSLRLWWKKCFSQLNFIVVPLLIHDLETDLLVRIKVCKLFLWGWVCPYLPYRQPPAAKSVLKDNFSIPQFVLAFPLENCCNTSYTGFPNFKFSLSLKW